MADISAVLVKELREKTGAGVMDCKSALVKTAGDIELAIDWLRKNGIATIDNKSSRVATEGLVSIACLDCSAAIVEVNSETDFVASNEIFQQFVRTVTELILNTTGSVATAQTLTYPGTRRTVAEELAYLVVTFGENIKLRRTQILSVPNGVVASYIHNAVAPGLGKIGTLVALESTCSNKNELVELGHHLAMHVAAAAPRFIDIASVDKATLDHERSILIEQVRASSKPDSIITRIVEGRLRKYYGDVVLLEQVYVIDGESRVADVIEHTAKIAGAAVKVTGFSRFVLGEGINLEKNDSIQT